MLGAMGRRGYRITPDWTFIRDDKNPDAVCDFATAAGDYYVDTDFEEGIERDFDISLQLKLKGYELKVATDNITREDPPTHIDKLLWKWGAYFDVEFRTRDLSYLRGLDFDNKLAVDSPFNVADGYGNMGTNLVMALLDRGLEVSASLNWKIQNRLDDLPEKVRKTAESGFGSNKRFGVRLSQPDSAQICPSNFKMNWSMWEFPTMPEHWVPGANSVDLPLVPCGWNKQLWREGGVTKPTTVVPLGFNPEHYFPHGVRQDKKTFTFYTDGSILGGNNLIELWQKHLGHRRDLELILKFPYPTEAKSSGNVRVISERVPTEVMRYLFWSADCYLYPTQAEGFGLFPIEAMATGLPVVATRLETMYSFINPDIAYPIPVESVDWFHYPDMATFFNQVVEIANGKWDYLGDKGTRAMEHVHTYWKWSDTVDKLLRLLNG